MWDFLCGRGFVQEKIHLLFIGAPFLSVLFQQCSAGNGDAVIAAVSVLKRLVICGKAAVFLQPPQNRVQCGFWNRKVRLDIFGDLVAIGVLFGQNGQHHGIQQRGANGKCRQNYHLLFVGWLGVWKAVAWGERFTLGTPPPPSGGPSSLKGRLWVRSWHVCFFVIILYGI